MVQPSSVPSFRPPSVSYVTTLTALAKLQGRLFLIRSRIHGLPAADQQRLSVLLTEIEVQIESLTRHLEAAQRAGLGPPF